MVWCWDTTKSDYSFRCFLFYITWMPLRFFCGLGCVGEELSPGIEASANLIWKYSIVVFFVHNTRLRKVADETEIEIELQMLTTRVVRTALVP